MKPYTSVDDFLQSVAGFYRGIDGDVTIADVRGIALGRVCGSRMIIEQIYSRPTGKRPGINHSDLNQLRNYYDEFSGFPNLRQAVASGDIRINNLTDSLFKDSNSKLNEVLGNGTYALRRAIPNPNIKPQPFDSDEIFILLAKEEPYEAVFDSKQSP